MTTTTIPPATVNTSGSTSYLTGTASGLDTASLIKAAVAQKTAPADTLDAKVTANTTRITAYQSLQSLITGLSTSMSKLASTTYSSVSTTTNAFQAKSVSVTASNSAAGPDIAVSADSTAAAATYTVTVDQLAAAQKVASSAMASTTALGQAGAFTLNDAVSAAQTINVTADMTLSDLASAINAVSAQSGVSASLIQVGTGSYKLVLSGNDTNQAITTSAASGGDVLASLGMTDSSGGFLDTLQAAQPALVTIDGTQISGDTNNLTDAVSGLSFSLLKTTAAGQSNTMTVSPDYSSVKTAITDFITAYNALRTFVTSNQAVGADGTPASGAVLFADPLLRNASQSLNAIISGTSASATGAFGNLADLGITLDSANQLSLSNQTTLDNALLGSLSQVSTLFQTTFTPSNSALKLLQNTSTSSFHFTLDVTADASGALTGASVNGDSSLFTVSGNLIVGAAGGPYAGLSFALVATGDTSISIDIAPGFANQIAAFASQFGDATTGIVQQQITSLGTQDAAWKTSSDKIRADATAYQTTLVNKYAAMEQEVSAALLLQTQIKALLGTSTGG
ncbi:MAG: flagellar hook protein [Phenylobacterium sp.]|jgi:flagellar hook-associated protein 2|nr:flagellar hook protein [Phenylobacterium sp.]